MNYANMGVQCWGLGGTLLLRSSSPRRQDCIFRPAGWRAFHAGGFIAGTPLAGIPDPSGIILIREREPIQQESGRLIRVYVYGDGTPAAHYSDDGDFRALEEGKLR